MRFLNFLRIFYFLNKIYLLQEYRPLPPVRKEWRVLRKLARACAGRVGLFWRVDDQYSRNVRREYLTKDSRPRHAQSSRFGSNRQVRATGTCVKFTYNNTVYINNNSTFFP